MKVFRTISNLPKYSYPVVVMGNFDGVHFGHQKILSALIKRAKENKGTSIVCTYNPNTKVFFGKVKEKELISTESKKISIFQKIGIDVCVIFNFTEEFSKMTAEEFVKNILVDQMGIKEFVIGYDTNFGSDRKGDKKSLEILAKKYNFQLTEVLPVFDETGKIVSSTNLRNL